MSHPTLAALVLAATALHAGFQVTVTALVYPALLADGRDWTARHARHSRRITPLVGATYVVLLAVGVPALLTSLGWGVAVAAVGAVVSLATTAVVAAPLHGRLGRGWDPALAHRLLVADRVRAVGAVVALAGGVLAVATG
ncbi:hypothetical protein [Lapillicoccus jejuensis]|uniref:DUF1772 domain-containing protein n=1 Tax=Lapillicoccus jejuensis TaxID=402171 RepID=A0A542DZZ4_9MICO|nr:hypothetical protein [Lapillicoccus jejuensis]TQJ08504.1 hypothetical protein FB458_1594 [Lapillicoccus jejuensis]